MTVNERWEQGIPHNPRSVELASELAYIDIREGNDFFYFTFGGDGDNGEHLLYLLDIYFERRG